MIAIENLTKFYGPVKGVEDISFTVPEGEIVGFLGPNGAGKTTTLKIITGYMLPSSGQVSVGDLNIYDDSLEIRRKIGYLPESAPLYADMEVTEYLGFIAALRQIPRTEQKAKIERMIELCGLTGVVRRPIGQLSKGYRQRVGLAQAMVHDPEILILDEPTSGLDPNQIVEIRNLIKTLGRKKTVILSTHILSEVQATCRRLIIISHGNIVADSPLEDLRDTLLSREKIFLELKTTDKETASKLQACPGVASVSPRPATEKDVVCFLVEAEPKAEPRADIFQMAVKNQWVILEMRCETASLEEVFRQVTTN